MEFLREKNYNQEQQRNLAEHNISMMTTEQLTVFNEFIRIIHDHAHGNINNQNLLFIDAPGGSGKTFVIYSILSFLRGNGKIVLATSTSGIVATLLSGGRTVHSTFKIPLNSHLIDSPTCNIYKANLIKNTSVIIVDACTMGHKQCI